MADALNRVILYDGVCGLCNRIVQFVLKRDSRNRFRFAALQSDFASQALGKHGLGAGLESVCLVIDFGQPGERVLTRSAAAIAIFRELGTAWRAMSNFVSIVPRRVRDWVYDLVARHRYGMFGKYDACPLPKPEDRNRFLA